MIRPRRRDTFSRTYDRQVEDEEIEEWDFLFPRIILNSYEMGKENVVSLSSYNSQDRGFGTGDSYPIKNITSQKENQKSKIEKLPTIIENSDKNILKEVCSNSRQDHFDETTLDLSPPVKKRCVLPRKSLPASGGSPSLISEISSTLAHATIESGYDIPEAPLFSQLPNDIILIIFRYIKNGTDLLAAACVSKRWFILASDANLWKSLYEYYYRHYELSLASRSWKFNFLIKRKELHLLNRSNFLNYRSKKKKHPLSPPKELHLPLTTSYKRTPPSKPRTIPSQPRPKPQPVEDAHLVALLEEKKQFFESFGSVSLVTTPCKRTAKRRNKT